MQAVALDTERRKRGKVTQPMAWETRSRGGIYYTRSRKVNGRTVREYIGGGLAGLMAANADEQAREEREVARRARVEREQADEAIDGLTENLIGHVDVLTRAALVAAGFHQHDRGEWRRRRNG